MGRKPSEFTISRINKQKEIIDKISGVILRDKLKGGSDSDTLAKDIFITLKNNKLIIL